MTYTLPDLDYDYGALAPHIAPEIMELHHSKHHAAYVAGANTALEQLAAAREKGEFGAIPKLEKDLAFHLGGHINHSVFWKNMSPDGGGEPDGDVAAAIDEFFGSFAGFKGHCSYFPHSGDVIRRLPAGAVLDHQWRDGTLRFPVDQPLSAALLRKLVEARLDLENEKGDVGPVARRFYANGRLAQKGKRRNGHMHGDWSFWRKDGSLMRTGTFKDGVQTGIWRTYDRDGFVVTETTF